MGSMFTSHVTDPSGTDWRVTLQLIPRRQGIGLRERFLRRKSHKKPNHGSHWYDFIDIPVLDGIDDLWLVLAIIAFFIIVVFIGWPLILLLSDFIWFIVVFLGGLLSYGVFGRPLTILAENGTQTHSWKIRGLFRAFERKQQIVENVRHGIFSDAHPEEVKSPSP